MMNHSSPDNRPNQADPSESDCCDDEPPEPDSGYFSPRLSIKPHHQQQQWRPNRRLHFDFDQQPTSREMPSSSPPVTSSSTPSLLLLQPTSLRLDQSVVFKRRHKLQQRDGKLMRSFSDPLSLSSSSAADCFVVGKKMDVVDQSLSETSSKKRYSVPVARSCCQSGQHHRHRHDRLLQKRPVAVVSPLKTSCGATSSLLECTNDDGGGNINPDGGAVDLVLTAPLRRLAGNLRFVADGMDAKYGRRRLLRHVVQDDLEGDRGLFQYVKATVTHWLRQVDHLAVLALDFCLNNNNNRRMP